MMEHRVAAALREGECSSSEAQPELLTWRHNLDGSVAEAVTQ